MFHKVVRDEAHRSEYRAVHRGGLPPAIDRSRDHGEPHEAVEEHLRARPELVNARLYGCEHVDCANLVSS